MRLRGKVAAITGAGTGIGQAAAKIFAAEGAHVLLLEINEAAGRETQAEIRKAGGRAELLRVDISRAEEVQTTFEKIRTDYRRLDVLYNNASIFLGQADAPVSQLSVDVWHRILGVNLHGLFYCCKSGIPLIADSGGGAVINTSSSAGVNGIPNCDAYTATKGATISLTRSMAVEYGPRKVRVNCIAPAAILTDMVRESNLKDPSFDEDRFLRVTPVRRWGRPEDIAQVALFLASDESAYLNGAVLVADGGITITPAFL